MILLTHNVDLDGLGSVILSKVANIKYSNILMYAYCQSDVDELLTYSNKEEILIVTDYRISKELYDHFSVSFKDFFVFDHHEESLNYKDDKKVFADTTKCGTKLFYENSIINKYKNNTSNYLVELIDTYDRWQKQSSLWQEALNLNRVLWNTIDYSMPDRNINKFKLFIDLQTEKIQNDFFRWTDYELDRISYARMKEKQAVQIATSIMQKREDSNGKKFALYFSRNKISWVCNVILEDNKELDYIICINTFQPNTTSESVNGKISVRSREGEFDVTTLINVNGHKSSGGGEFTIDFLNNMWSNKIHSLPYRRL